METSSNLPSSSSSHPLQMATRDRLKLALKFGIVILVFWYLSYRGMMTGESLQRLAASPSSISICLVLMVLNTLLGAFRWQVLLRTQGAKLTLRRVLGLNLVGCFFNIALPGAVSGDFVKAIYVAKQFKDNRGPIFGSILFDRILGVSAMVFVAAVSALISILIPWGGHIPEGLLWGVGGAGLLALFFFVYLFVSHWRDPLYWVLQFFTKRVKKLAPLDNLYQGVMNYRHHPLRIMKAIALSILIHLLVILLAFFLTEAISPEPISIVALAVVVPIGMLATSIPVLPAGVGTGHAAFYALFKLIGSNQGAEVFSLIILFQVLVGIIGGMVYLKISAENKLENIQKSTQENRQENRQEK